MKKLNEVELEEIMPLSLTRDEDTLQAARSIDPELKLAGGASAEAYILTRIGELDEKIIDMLAWQYHVDFYELAGSLEVKRDLVRNAIIWHMKKGTKFAILRALEMLGIDAEYENWYEFGGEPYTFRLSATVRAEYYMHSEYEEIVKNIHRAVEDSKAARSCLAELVTKILMSDELDLKHGIGVGLTGHYEIGLSSPAKEYELKNYSGIATGLTGHRETGLAVGIRELSCGLVSVIWPEVVGGFVGVKACELSENEREYINNL